jgi:hypothetical protein
MIYVGREYIAIWNTSGVSGDAEPASLAISNIYKRV